MHERLSKRGKVATTFMAVLLVITLTAALLPKATATPTLTISIYPVSGTVGTEVEVNGTIDTLNGSYTIRWDGTLNVTTGYATGYNVTTSFVIPQTVGAPSGRDVLIELIDNNKTVDNVVNATFKLYTKYYVKAVFPSPPSQLQEGQPTEIWVNITGGEANTVYSANITVTDPSGTVYYNDTLQLTNTTNTGYSEGSIMYPANFSLGANTDYVGVYTISFNGTLATGNFTVGLTDKIEYRRMRTVKIQGSGYNASENVTVDITTAGASVVGYPKNVTADSNGVVKDSWTIPINATAGTYKVTLTNASTPGTIKPIPDAQNFTVLETIIPLSIDPTSGRWGTRIRVVGEIVTLNGPYQIRWDGKSIKNGTCAPGSTEVDDTFIVPPSAQGTHNITLYDVNQSIESMPATFNVTASFCYVSTDPTRIQEGLHTTITVIVNEAEANATLTFTLNVTDPQAALYTATLNVSTNATGSGSNTILYYKDFSAGANTNYIGTYTIVVGGVNRILATENFTVGLTDRLNYGRTETEVVSVLIRGAGYPAEEIVIVNVTFAGEPVGDYPKNITADQNGIVTDSWTIPSNATLGIYTVTLTNAAGMQVKPIPDVQNFTVTEVIVYLQTQNRYDKEPLAGVSVKAYLDETYVASGTTNETGWITLQVSYGNYTFKAFWKTMKVGSLNYNVLENATLPSILPPIECELASLTITIRDEAGFPLPFINVALASNKTGVSQFETNSTGVIKTNTFTNISYTIEARRYDHLFNTTQIANLTVTQWVNITCPTYTLFVNVLDSKGIPLQNVEVEAYEWSSGVAEPVQSETTDALGSAVFHLTFGRYKVWVYNEDRTIILNKTVVDMTEDQLFFVVYCKIFPVDLSVIVKDYFGQPIPNALVKVEREGEEIPARTQKTGSKGIAPFYNITGGNLQISVTVMGQICETRTLYLDETTVIAFKLEKFVVVGGYPLEVIQLITYLSLGIAIAVFALALIYRRLRPRKVPEGEEKEKSL